MYSGDGYYQPGTKKFDYKFLPARYAVEVMANFSNRTGGKVKLKLTAPTNLLVKKSNIADDWEAKVIEIFKKDGYEKGSPYSEVVEQGGQKVYRQLLPEYYNKSCMGCHGKTGGPEIHNDKPVGKKGQLGGAISVSIHQ